ncbi:MAG: CoA pyrophosphatase [Pirellulales bacterium]|nr:CoA pyrophosphatase [Pirellulales bacterium]
MPDLPVGHVSLSNGTNGMFDADLGERLQRQLAFSRPVYHSRLAPDLAYGRHRGPAWPTSRLAAVAVAIYKSAEGAWVIPLTLRPRTLQHHGGQVCLPGGRLESGESFREAATREFEEELGVPTAVRQFCGGLSPQYVYASDNLVRPQVFLVEPPRQRWRPDKAEVAEVILMPLSVLIDPARRVRLLRSPRPRPGLVAVKPFQYGAGAIEYEGYQIWGATAMILDELAQILLECQ